jgi:hypothetical protein
MIKRITFFLASTFFSFSYSQSTEKTVPDSPSKIRVFSPSTSSASKSDSSYKWCVKTDVFSILTGEFPIIGEYRIAKKLSVEAYAGLTYGYMNGNILFSSEELNSTNGNNSSYYDSQSAEMGSSFRASFKYFPSSDYDAIEGWYFGVQLMTKTINRGYGESSELLKDGKDSFKKSGVAIIIGKQIFADSNIVWDFYFGGGIANVKHNFLSTSYDSNTNITSVLSNENSKSGPNILLGLRVGFGD